MAVRLIARRNERMRDRSGDRAAHGRSPERLPAAKRGGALRALESCRTAAWMELRPSELMMPGHMRQYGPCHTLIKAARAGLDAEPGGGLFVRLNRRLSTLHGNSPVRGVAWPSSA